MPRNGDTAATPRSLTARARRGALGVAPVRAGALLAIAAVMLVGCAASPKQPSQGAGGERSEQGSQTDVGAAVTEEFTPVIARQLSEPIAAASSDGMTHLAYELQLTNVLSQTVGLDGLTVEADGRELLALDAQQLATRTQVIGGGDPGSLAAGQSALLVVDVSLAGGEAEQVAPASLQHELRISPAQAQPPVFSSPMTEQLPAVMVSDREPVVIGPPLTGSGWLDGNGCCDMTPHRLAINPINGRYSVPERYAIDFVRLDADGRIFDGPIDDDASYAFLGSDVIAVADGPVVAMTTDRPQEKPGAHPSGLTLDEYGGNYVVQDIGGGNFAFYAHLAPDNPLGIAVGQQLKRGDTLGLLGNSGNTDMPHLHFHIMDSPAPLASDGLPFLIERYTVAGTVTEAGLQACMTDPVSCKVDRADPTSQHATSPLYHDVLNFDG